MRLKWANNNSFGHRQEYQWSLRLTFSLSRLIFMDPLSLSRAGAWVESSDPTSYESRSESVSASNNFSSFEMGMSRLLCGRGWVGEGGTGGRITKIHYVDAQICTCIIIIMILITKITLACGGYQITKSSHVAHTSC